MLQQTPIPSLRLDSRDIPEDRRLATWAQMIPAYEVSQLDARETFSVCTQAWLVGSFAFSFTEVSAVRMARSPERIVADGRDDISIILNPADAWFCDVDGKVIEVPAGNVCILDNAIPFAASARAGSFVIAVAPRTMLEAVLPPDVHGCVLEGMLGLLFADYLRVLVRRLPELVVEDAPAVMNATRELLSGSLRALSRPGAARSRDPALLVRARHFIDRNLRARLTAADVARELGLSRSGLYRAFAPVGGVEHFITRRRLARAHAALRDVSGRKTIAAVAYESGFSSAAHFTRLFKAEYGSTPRTLRMTCHQPRLIQRHSDAVRSYRAWTGVSG